MKKVIVGVFCFMASFGFSQTMGGGVDMAGGGNILLSRMSSGNEEIQGSKYFMETYLLAKVSGHEDEKILLRYNAVDDQMEFQKNGELYMIPKTKEGIIVFSTEKNKTYKYVTYQQEELTLDGYLVVLGEGEKISVYKKEFIKYVEAKEAANSYDKGKPAHYKKMNDLFFISKDTKVELFPKNKKELLKMFPDQSTQISDYLKKNKVSFSKEADLIDLTKFLNTL